MKTALVKLLAGTEGGRTLPFYGKVYSTAGRSLAVEGEEWSVKVYFEASNLPTPGKWCVAGVRMLSEKAPKEFLTDRFTLFEGRKRTLMGIPILEAFVEEKKGILKGVLKEADKTDGNGNFYPRAVLEKAVEEFNKRDFKFAVIRDIDVGGPFSTDLADVACEIQVKMEPVGAVAEVTKILDTPKGRKLQRVVHASEKTGFPLSELEFGVRGIGSTTVRPDGVREIGPDFTIDSVSILPSKDKA